MGRIEENEIRGRLEALSLMDDVVRFTWGCAEESGQDLQSALMMLVQVLTFERRKLLKRILG